MCHAGLMPAGSWLLEAVLIVGEQPGRITCCTASCCTPRCTKTSSGIELQMLRSGLNATNQGAQGGGADRQLEALQVAHAGGALLAVHLAEADHCAAGALCTRAWRDPWPCKRASVSACAASAQSWLVSPAAGRQAEEWHAAAGTGTLISAYVACCHQLFFDAASQDGRMQPCSLFTCGAHSWGLAPGSRCWLRLAGCGAGHVLLRLPVRPGLGCCARRRRICC